MGRTSRIVLLIVVFGVSLARSLPEQVLAAADGQAPARRGHSPITYVGTVATNFVYLPLKLVYAGSGGLIAGLAYLFTAGDEDAFFGIWEPAGQGTYLVTPSMLEGTEQVRFVGP